MEPDIALLSQKISALEEKIDKVYASSEKIRKYFLWTGIITIAVIVIPLLLLPLVLPSFIQSVTIPAGY